MNPNKIPPDSITKHCLFLKKKGGKKEEANREKHVAFSSFPIDEYTPLKSSNPFAHFLDNWLLDTLQVFVDGLQL